MVMRTFLTVVLLTASALAQAPALASARPSFEVASIKPAAPLTPGQMKMGMTQDPGRVNIQGLPLGALIARAYRLKAYQISGPDWLNSASARFDVLAKLPAGASEDQVPEMLQVLLEDRFQLKFHREPKELPVYALVIGKNGLKMTPLEETEGDKSAPANRVRLMPGHLETERITLSALADLLSSFVDRPIVDQTETKGPFKLKLDFALDTSVMNSRAGGKMVMMQREGGGPGPGASELPSADPSGPSIFTAVQEQLGLKLDAKKSPVDILVIDHLEKTPTEN